MTRHLSLALASLLLWPIACGGESVHETIGYASDYDPGGDGGGGGAGDNDTYDACVDAYQAANDCASDAGFQEYADPYTECAYYLGIEDESWKDYYECLADAWWSADCSSWVPDVTYCDSHVR